MAKAISICYKNKISDNLSDLAKTAAKRIEPNNVIASKPYIFIDENILTLVYNPSSTIVIDDANVCLGQCDNSDSLFVLNSPLPNGSYALFRIGAEEIEIASDYAGSRTLWFYHDDDVFMASTSQRLILAFLDDFQLNKKTCSWFLCTGTLGPGLSWDKRLKMIFPRMRLKLNRPNWKVTLDAGTSFDFKPLKFSENGISYYKIKLKRAVEESVKDLNINPSDWMLALSGGMDSRSLLYHLQDEKLTSVTWGLDSAMEYPTSDAQIAKKLASKSKIKHSYSKMDFKPNSFPALMHRFLAAGEGRVDHLSGYLDGLELWGNLSRTGRGVIRGYDAFGRKPPVTNSYQVRRTCNLMTSFDYSSTDIPKDFAVFNEDIPTVLNQKEGESLGDWRDRLWLQYRTPITTAALEDIKLAYVEVINPLLSKKVVETVQQIPLELRANKKIWKSIVSEMFPDIPIARREAVQEVGQILNLKEVRNHICDTLLTHRESSIFPKSHIDLIVMNYNKDHRKQSIRRKLRRLIIAYLPKSIENKIRANLKPGPLSTQWLALRTFMIVKTIEMLRQDSRLSEINGT